MRFTIDSRPSQVLAHSEALELLESRAAQHGAALDAIAAGGDNADRERAAQHRAWGKRLFDALAGTLQEDAARR